jgi:hypothetical protein
VPSGAFSEELCGQPEQKNGARWAIGQLGRAAEDLVEAAQVALGRLDVQPAGAQPGADRAAIRSASRSSSRGSSGSPRSSRLPTMRGAPATP